MSDIRTVADVLIATLAASGVRRIYGLPGDSINGLTDSIRRSDIAWQHVRHEEAAAFAAAADAGLTGELAVCAGSCGPGNLHLINGLYDAQRSLVPVLAIAAHIPRHEIGTSYFQETHPQSPAGGRNARTAAATTKRWRSPWPPPTEPWCSPASPSGSDCWPWRCCPFRSCGPPASAAC